MTVLTLIIIIVVAVIIAALGIGLAYVRGRRDERVFRRMQGH